MLDPGGGGAPTKNKKKKKVKRTTTSTVNATLGGEGVRRVNEAVERVEREEKRERKQRKRKKARREQAQLDQLTAIAEGKKTPAEVAAQRAARKVEKQTKRGDLTPDPIEKSAFDIFGEEARTASAQGVATRTGLVSKKTAGDIRTLTTGSRNPNLGELALAAAPIPTVKGMKIVRTVLRGSKGLKTAERAAKTKRAADAARKARKAETAAEKAKAGSRAGKARATGKGVGREAKARLSKVERQARRAKRQDRAVNAATSAPLAAAAASPGDVGDKTRAFIEGTVKADPKKAIPTTLRSIPAALGYGATVVGDTAHAAVTGDTGPLEGSLKQGAKALKALEPLVSGDAEAVEKATEDDLGYVFAPLGPRGAITKPVAGTAKALGRGTRRTVRRITPDAKGKGRVEQPGSVRRAKQVITGGKTRKRIAVAMSRAKDPLAAEAKQVSLDIDKPLRKVRRETEDVVAALVRYGISREDPIGQLKLVGERHTPAQAPAGTMTVRDVLEYAAKHPDEFTQKGLWDAVDAYKKDAPETSPVAKYRAQGDTFDVRPPEDRITPRAQEMIGNVSRGEAFAILKNQKKALRKTRQRANKQGSAADVLRYLDEAEATELLHNELDPLVRPGQSLEGKRTKWTKPMVDEYVKEVQAAAREAGFEEPAWTSELGPDTVSAAGVRARGVAGPRKQRVKTGESARTDVADRSLRALITDSVWRPRMQKAVNRFIRQVVEEFAIPVTVRRGDQDVRVTEITSREYNELVKSRKIDSREVVAVPAREYKQAALSDDFDLDNLRTNFNQRLKGEIRAHEGMPGDKYVLMPREAVAEMIDQLNPSGGAIEGGMSSLGSLGSRVVLFSPAWASAQIVAEGLQAGAAIGPIGWAKAAKNLHYLKKHDPEGYQAFAHQAGVSPASLEQPGQMRLAMEGNTQQQFAAAGRALRRTAVGRAIYATGTLKLFGLLDRWKSGKYRTVIAAARVDKEFNSFVSGVQGMMREQDAIAKKLKGMKPHEQLSYIARHPKMFDKHLDYLDDVAGNWQAFTRYERQFAPLVMFYPFLRMSLRWTFWSYPKHHPVRAQMLYLLGQQQAEEIDKLLGPGNAKFIDYAMPVMHDEDGKAAAVLPGGQRFASPGLNILTQTIGEDNLAGLGRALNPALSIPFYAASGVDPMSGQQDPNVNRAKMVLQQLLSLSPEARVLGLNELGEEQTAAGEKFEEFDPQRDIRSFAAPFLPQSAKNARKEAKLSRAFGDAGEGVRSEAGQFIQMADELGLKEAIKTQATAEDAKDEIEAALKGAETAAQKRKIKRYLDAFYALKYPSKPDAGPLGGSSSSNAGPLASAGTSSKGPLE